METNRVSSGEWANTPDRLKAVITIGRPDFGRCPAATRLNRALWPLAGRPVLERLLDHVAGQGLRRAVVCGSEDLESIRRQVRIPRGLNVEYRQERLPRGSAGCVYDAADPAREETIIVLPGTMISPPDLRYAIREHRRRRSPLTIFFNPSVDPVREPTGEAQIYICEPPVLEQIPAAGYCDLKEGLLPKLIRAGLPAAFSRLERPAGSFTCWEEYLDAVKDWLCRMEAGDVVPEGFERHPAFECVYTAPGARIDPSARIMGPVMVGERSVIGPRVLICGPALIESDVRVCKASVLCESVLWPGVLTGPRCFLRQCLVDSRRALPARTDAWGALLPAPRSLTGRFRNALRRFAAANPGAADSNPITLSRLMASGRSSRLTAAGLLLLTAALLFAYWKPTLTRLAGVWAVSDEYSSGMLVPVLAAYLLWHRRERWLERPIRPTAAGFVLLLGAQLMRFFGLLYYYDTLDRYSLLLTVAALVILIGGTGLFKKIFTVWLFGFLMFPFPTRLESGITFPLQKWATISAVYFLETLGYNVVRDGNIITINDTQVAVAEACNGLRMLTAFFVVSGFVVLLTHRKRWQKGVLLLSSIPIALLCNTLRLTITSIAFTTLNTEQWEKRFHDFGGLAMMPVALLMIILELWFLSHLFLPSSEPETSGIVVRRRQDSSIKDGSFTGTP
jgi:exosortase